MVDHVIDKARLRLEELEREAAEIRTFIRMYSKFSGPTATVGPKPSGHEQGNGSVLNVARPSGDFNTRDEIVNAAREVLKAHAPEAIHISQLYETLVASGIRINGRNPKGNLSAKLAPPPDLVYVKDRGWIYRPEKDEALAEQSARASSVTGEAGTSPIESESKGFH